MVLHGSIRRVLVFHGTVSYRVVSSRLVLPSRRVPCVARASASCRSGRGHGVVKYEYGRYGCDCTFSSKETASPRPPPVGAVPGPGPRHLLLTPHGKIFISWFVFRIDRIVSYRIVPVLRVSRLIRVLHVPGICPSLLGLVGLYETPTGFSRHTPTKKPQG